MFLLIYIMVNIRTVLL